MVGCLSLALKFSIPTGCCRNFQGNGGQHTECSSGGASFQFNSAARCAIAARSLRSAKCSDFVTGTVGIHQRQLRVVQGVFGAWWCRLLKSGRYDVCCNEVLCKRTKKRAGGWRHVEHFPSRPLQGSSFALKIVLNKRKFVNGQFFKELFPPLAPSACHSGWRPCGAELS